MNSSVAVAAGLATGIPVIVLVSIYVVYCCCCRKLEDRSQEPRLWRRDIHGCHDPYIPPFVPRIVQKFVQHSHHGTCKSSSATSIQTSPVEEKSFFSEDSGSYRTAPDDSSLPEKRHSLGSYEALNVPANRRTSVLQLSTSSGESSESIYEQRKSSDVKSPRNFPKSSSRSFEFVRPIPVKPLITITRVESRDDMNATKAQQAEHADPNGHSHSDSQVLPIRKPPKPSRSLDNVSVPLKSTHERKRSTDRSLGVAGRRKESVGGSGEDQSKKGAPAKIPVNIPSQILQARELPARDLRNNTSSPYVRVYALPSRRHNHRTTVIENNLHPVWNELFIISGLTLSDIRQLALQFLVIHHQPVSRNVVIGEAILTLGKMDLSGDEVNVWKELRPHHFQNVRRTYSNCSFNPYVKVELFSANHRLAKKKTRIKKKTVNPKFAQTFNFDLGGKISLDHMTLMCTILVHDSSGCHERIGQVVLSTAAGDGPEFDHWSQVVCNPHCPIDQWHMIHE
ncbi:Synaptotagmin-7 [Acropora cervicornis]|uniref:Synaptotagmin-7 n=1 Tax=Acropora cervicornis TaxID=6130 RepID=A0AAD9UXP5_ACRCE|nr:Synaptotagmin-7 [Acropora cervicornis]